MLSNGVHFKAGYYCFEVSVFSFMERGYVMIKYSKEEVMQLLHECNQIFGKKYLYWKEKGGVQDENQRFTRRKQY